MAGEGGFFYDWILGVQEKYILEVWHPMDLPKGQWGDHPARLTPIEVEQFRSIHYEFNWVAKEPRAELGHGADPHRESLEHKT